MAPSVIVVDGCSRISVTGDLLTRSRIGARSRISRNEGDDHRSVWMVCLDGVFGCFWINSVEFGLDSLGRKGKENLMYNLGYRTW